MKAYVVMRYWDNDETYPEDFFHYEEPVKVFQSLKSAVNYLNALTTTDILGPECKSEDGWYLDESEKWHYKFSCEYKSFHARNHDETYYETANIIFKVVEVEMEVEE